MQGDKCASILIRCLHLLSAFLETIIHVEHLPRVSSWESVMVDDMSRKKTTTSAQKSLVNSFSHLKLPRVFSEWLKNPVEDWNLPFRLLSIVKDISV